MEHVALLLAAHTGPGARGGISRACCTTPSCTHKVQELGVGLVEHVALLLAAHTRSRS